MRELPRDLVTILRTEARNQRTPPIEYVIAEDGGRMVHRPEPDIAMAELLEEAADALEAAAEREEKLIQRAGRYFAETCRLEARIAELEAGYAEAISDIEDWSAYAGGYIQDKHDLKGCLEQHRALLHPTSETPPVSATSEGGVE